MNDKSADKQCPSASSSRSWSWSGIEMSFHCLDLKILVPRQLPGQQWEPLPACACGMLRRQGFTPRTDSSDWNGSVDHFEPSPADQLLAQPPVPAAILLPAVARKLEKLFVLPPFVWAGQRKGIQMIAYLFTHTQTHTKVTVKDCSIEL